MEAAQLPCGVHAIGIAAGNIPDMELVCLVLCD
jgi:hypothetical protein